MSIDRTELLKSLHLYGLERLAIRIYATAKAGDAGSLAGSTA